jgi:hypothetical protein
MVDISTKILYQTLHHGQITHLDCLEERRHSNITRLINVGAELLDQAYNHIQVILLDCQNNTVVPSWVTLLTLAPSSFTRHCTTAR